MRRARLIQTGRSLDSKVAHLEGAADFCNNIGPKASMPEIGSWATKNVELLKRQVELYRPHLTIACGTFDIVREVFGITTTPICDGDPNMDKYHLPHEALGVLLNFYHPQTRRSASIMFNWMERNIQYLRLAKVLTI
jgi:hypothetical protein